MDKVVKKWKPVVNHFVTIPTEEKQYADFCEHHSQIDDIMENRGQVLLPCALRILDRSKLNKFIRNDKIISMGLFKYVTKTE